MDYATNGEYQCSSYCRLDTKCSSSEIAFYTDEYRCYCNIGRGRLRKRITIANRIIVARLKSDTTVGY